MSETTLFAILGGALIGLGAAALLLFNGRIAGVSGIVGSLLARPSRSEALWRLLFVAGLVAGGALVFALQPQLISQAPAKPLALFAAAGLLVGLGTKLGSGCTSGHGVCGVARLSRRSLVATATFTGAGAITVFLMTRVFGG